MCLFSKLVLVENLFNESLLPWVEIKSKYFYKGTRNVYLKRFTSLLVQTGFAGKHGTVFNTVYKIQKYCAYFKHNKVNFDLR